MSSSLVNLAFLAVRGGPRDRVTRLVENRGGNLLAEAEGLPTFSFSSPTDAVLTGLRLTETEVAACCAVTAGEIELGDGPPKGRALDAAGELAARGDHGEVLLVEAVFFAMNRNEVSAIPLSSPPENALQQRVFVGAPVSREPSPEPPPAPDPSPPPRSGTLETLLLVLGLGGAFLGGVSLAGREAPPSWEKSPLVQQAESLTRKQLHREAAHAYLHAFRAHPGRPELERSFGEQQRAAAEERLRADRPDQAYALLREGQEETPHDGDWEEPLVRTGLDYLDALLEKKSEQTFEAVRSQFLTLFPLRERDLRDQVVALQARRALQQWRTSQPGHQQSKLESQVNALWEESPGNPELHLAAAEFQARSGRYEYMQRSFEKALEQRPEWVRERPELVRLAMESLTSMRQSYVRGKQLESHVGFLVQHLGDRLVPAARAALGDDSVGLRNGALAILRATGAGRPEEFLGVLQKNLAGIKSVDEKESPRGEELLLRWIPELAESMTPAQRGALRDSVKRALRAPELPAPVAERLGELEGKL